MRRRRRRPRPEVGYQWHLQGSQHLLMIRSPAKLGKDAKPGKAQAFRAFSLIRANTPGVFQRPPFGLTADCAALPARP